ncbi:formyltransferase family protein [Aquimarina litoralis]|uniref:formyltransferase family protein n=1 Tax=Aquimarina litoralis TaxID=584605 RepID=UPI001C560FCD|nr:formyltransferase family protein [Aquimarina litoralis]MBW1293894.1 methionyl-tRNA formyltransferase [Aquimarina litoralis]
MNNFVVLSEKTWNTRLVENLKKNIPDAQWLLINNKSDFLLENLKKINPSKIFIPHWSYIIPAEIFSSFECIVFHMTDLPYGRGGSPLQNLIVRGHKKTKVSALKVVKELDAGPIYLKQELDLYGTAEEIFIRTNETIEEMIVKIVSNNLSPIEQEGEPVFFKRRKPAMSEIAQIDEIGKLYDHIRMLDAEGYPKAYFENDHFKFEFTRASLKSNNTILADVRIIKK